MKIFDRARLRLTGWYVIVISLISLTFSFVIYRIEVLELARYATTQRVRIENRLGPGPGIILIDTEFLDEIKARLITRLVIFNGIVILLSGGLGYFLAGRTLAPIELMVAEQRRFISDAAHELRTPLTAMRSSLEVFLRDKKPRLAEAKTLIQDNAEDVLRLQQLANSLLTLSHLSENGQSIEFEPVELKQLANKVVRRLQGVAEHSQVKLITKLSQVTVQGNREQLAELITILVDNAIKYSSPSQGKVQVSLSKSRKSAQIIVADNGAGISKKDLPHIFTRFYRSDTARATHGRGGYGLGLSIAKRIVTIHQGKISVASHLGQGSKFIVLLPLS